MSLNPGYKRRSVVPLKDERQTASKVSQEMGHQQEQEVESYYFENVFELATYGKLFAKDKRVNWLSGDNYMKLYQRGYQLFEQGRYQEALLIYNDCLKLNPIGISARFEMCESLLRLGELNAAEGVLMELQQFLLFDEKQMAKFYRRFGYIKIEEGDLRAAAACYQYSRSFENHPSIQQELAYIKAKGGPAIPLRNSEQILREAGIPIITAERLR